MARELAGKRILLGITGSIAAYKSAELIRLLTGAGAEVRVAATQAAAKLIGPPTLQALSGRPVLTDMFAGTGSPDGMDHIAAAREADCMVIAPASAQTLAQLAGGLADSIVASLALAAECPVMVAPAMNRAMWASPAVQRNVRTLAADGRMLVGPGSGEQACGETGPGRMAEPEEILAQIVALLTAGGALAGRTIAVSAGATAVMLDDMRMISNLSTGRMGCALAAAAAAAGARVILLAARMEVAPPPGMSEIVHTHTNDELMAASLQIAGRCDAYIAAAAVADWQPAKRAAGKPARTKRAHALQLEAAPDIIAAVAALPQAPLCVAFAAEAGAQPVAAARRKMRSKGVHAIVASPLADNLGGESSNLTLIAANLEKPLGRISKAQAARELIAAIAGMLKPARLKKHA